MHKSALTFGLLMSSLVMLAILPFLNNSNNAAMAQGYNSYGIVIIANTQPTTKNMNVEQVRSKASL